MSRLHGDAHEAGEVLLTLGVPGSARLTASFRPATVPVHDAPDVHRTVRMSTWPDYPWGVHDTRARRCENRHDGCVARTRDGGRRHPGGVALDERRRLGRVGRPPQPRRRTPAAHAGSRSGPTGPIQPTAPMVTGGGRWTRASADGRCTVIVDGTSDGRVEFARAAATIPADAIVDEKRIDAALYAPATADPTSS